MAGMFELTILWSLTLKNKAIPLYKLPQALPRSHRAIKTLAINLNPYIFTVTVSRIGVGTLLLSESRFHHRCSDYVQWAAKKPDFSVALYLYTLFHGARHLTEPLLHSNNGSFCLYQMSFPVEWDIDANIKRKIHTS